MSILNPVESLLNQTSGDAVDGQAKLPENSAESEITKKTFSNAEISNNDTSSKDPASGVLLQGNDNIISDNPLEDLLRNHGTVPDLIKKENAGATEFEAKTETKNSGISTIEKKLEEDKDNPIIVLTKEDENGEDDEDDGEGITLSVRQPSFSSLHGVLIPKGLSKPKSNLAALSEEKPEKSKFTSSAEKLKVELNSQRNPIIVAGAEDDDDDDDGQAISLSVRQPSFSNLKGQLIPKGATKAPTLPSLEETPQEEKKESDSSYSSDENDANNEEPISACMRQTSYQSLHGEMIPKGSNSEFALDSKELILEESARQEEGKKVNDAANDNHEEDDFGEDPVKPDKDDDDDEGEAISLSARQPSFSNLKGKLVLKGSTTALPTLSEDDSIVAEKQPQEDAQQILLNQISARDPVHGEILRSLHQFNEDRWKDLGYDPNKESEMVLSSQIQEMNQKDGIGKVITHNKSCANYYPKVIEITTDKPDKASKKRVKSSRSRGKLELEMPEEMQTQKSEKKKVYEEGDDIIDEDDGAEASDEDQFSETLEVVEEQPRLISSAGGHRNPSQIFDILPNEMLNDQKKSENAKAVHNTPDNGKTKKKSGSTKKRKQQKDEGLDSDFYLDLDELRTEQGYDSEQGSAKIPPKLYELITHPKESVVFLALCGVSIAGYREKTVRYVRKELNNYLNQCVQMGLIEESMYVKNILDKIKNEQEAMKNAIEEENEEALNSKLDEVNNEMEKRSQYWDRQEEQLDAQKEVAMNELEMKKNEAINDLGEEWQSEKMQNKYNKPSPQLVELRRTAQRLIGAHRFQEAAVLSNEIGKREEEETRYAARKMEEDYMVALQRLNEKYLQEKQTLELSFETRRSTIRTNKEKSLIPVQNKAARVQHEKEVAEKKKMLAEREERANMITRKTLETKQQMPRLNGQSVITNRKLSLPPLKRIIRPITSTRSKK